MYSDSNALRARPWFATDRAPLALGKDGVLLARGKNRVPLARGEHRIPLALGEDAIKARGVFQCR